MTKVLVVYGSQHGGTRGIAERIGEALRTQGCDTDVVSADRAGEIETADAVVIGSGVYMGSWLKEPLEFVRRNVDVLAQRPIWFFSSGPLAGSTAAKNAADPMVDVLGPQEGPGSGGRKKVDELAAATHARENHIFVGAFDPGDPPRSLSERLIRLMPASKNILPPGDFRDWDAIDAWARGIATTLTTEALPA